ncbi:MAG: helix-turn-helix transcriptional regulator [Clostridia bacterium]|nr:helix-turn-helix transcriptional regulator [Clostridia bacterium]
MVERKLPKIQYSKVEKRRKFTGPHTHEYYELYYLISGETAYFVGDEIYRLVPGNFILVPKGMIHSTDSQTCLHNERLLVTFDEDIFDPRTLPFLQMLCKKRLICIKEGNLHLFTELLSKLQKEPDSTSALAVLYVLELIVMLGRYGASEGEGLQPDTLISEVTGFIRQSYASELSLYNLSRQFGISESSLSRRFKAEVGIGLWEFITQVRIFNAESILLEEKMTVTRAAELCGFSDSNYFATVFKKAKGITPLRYRKNNLK